MTSPKPEPDWDRIETEYRVGLKTLREIAAPNGITEGAIRKRAKRDKWERDLSHKINARTEEIVRKAAVVRAKPRSGKPSAYQEGEIVEVNATVRAEVRLKHQSTITRFQKLAVSMLAELEDEFANLPGLDDLADLLVKPDRNGQDKLNEIYRSIIAMPGRTKAMKDLADVLKTLIGLEREAHGIASVKENEEVPGIQPDISTDPRAAYQWLAGQKPKST